MEYEIYSLEFDAGSGEKAYNFEMNSENKEHQLRSKLEDQKDKDQFWNETKCTEILQRSYEKSVCTPR